MNASVYVLPPALTMNGQPVPQVPEHVDLLRQLVALQQEQITLLKAQQAHHDANAKWRTLLTRWQGEFPGIGTSCKQMLPELEREYLTLVRDLTEKLASEPDALSDEFMLSEFLDRYGMRLAQLGNIISQLSQLADASTPEKG